MAVPFSLSKDGIELQLASNHVGHWYLTVLLQPIIEATARTSGSSRVVNVSSMGHFMPTKNGIDFDNINNEKAYSPYPNYGQSKLANILFSRALQKRMDANVFVNSLHPGVVKTELAKNAAYMSCEFKNSLFIILYFMELYLLTFVYI